MGDGIRGGWKNGANKFDKLVYVRRTRHLCLAIDLRFVKTTAHIFIHVSAAH